MKKLLLAFVCYIFVTAGAAADTYTNITTLSPGFSLIANQLDHGSNTLDEILTNPVCSSCGVLLAISKYDCTNWRTVTFYDAIDTVGTPGWYDDTGNPSTMTLAPGEGAVIEYRPASGSNALFLTFTGTPHVPVLPAALACGTGAYNLLSRQTNDIGTYQNVTGLTPAAGAQFLTMSNSAVFAFTTNTFDGLNWNLGTPSLGVGRAALVFVPSSTNPAYTLPIPAGLSLIANQLDHGSNTLDEVMPGVPDGCVFFKYNNAASNWTAAAYNANSGSWTPDNVALNPGEGGFIQSPSAFSLVFTGRPHVPILPVAIANGRPNLLSRQTNDVGNYASIVGSAPLNHTVMSLWNGVGYTPYVYSGGSWSSGGTNGPNVPLGSAVWISPPPGGALPALPVNYSGSVPAGLSLIANQLDHGSNTLNEILPGVPDGCVFFKYDNLTNRWTSSAYDAGSARWNPTNITLNPGEGGFIQCPTAFSFVFTGQPHVPVLPVAIPAGAAYLLSRQTNDIGNYANIAGVPPASGAVLYRWNNTDSSYTAYTYPSDLSATDPALNIGESVWISPSGTLPPPVLLTSTNCVPPFINHAGFSSNVFTLSFQSLASFAYLLQCKNSLSDVAWTPLQTIIGDGGNVTVHDAPTPQKMRFYRIVCQGPLAGALTSLEPPQPPAGQPVGGGGCGAGEENPLLYLFSGEYHETVKDLVIKGRGMDFVWARKYRSIVRPNTAAGNGWDFSYNMHVLADGTGFTVFDGNGRSDAYYLQSDGTYGASQLFNLGTLSNNVFTLEFPDTGLWQFLPLDGSASQGKIDRMTDRNGNALGFSYDGAGRLTNILDTLGRNIAVSYNGDGFVSALTDFAGRQISYAYYQNGDPGGSQGDLKSVTSPIVINTPNGNDFPSGKTVAYSYTTGNADDHLNHMVLTTTDALGQTWLSNTYAATTDPANINYGRLMSQRRGYSNEVLSFFYTTQIPTPANHFAVIKAIVNDRMGNVSEYLFDYLNRPVRLRQFTGRATPGIQTTESQNRPTGQLRVSDPAYFETEYSWNADSKPVSIVYPNGNILSNIYEGDLNPGALRRSRSNVRIRQMFPGPKGGDQAVITESFIYDTTFGCGCGFNFATQATDGRGNITYNSYDAHGNLTNTTPPIASAAENYEYNQYGQVTAHVLPDNGSGYRRRDLTTYYASGPQTGYLYQQIMDSQTLVLTTTFEHDAVGNVVRLIDPNGHDSLYTFNALNQLLQETSVETTGGSGIRFTNYSFYDADNNRIRVDIENADGNGQVSAALPVLTTTYEFDILNFPTRSTQPMDGSNSVVTEIIYDANHQQSVSRSGKATSGVDPFNIVQTLHDERKMPFQEIRGAGGADQSSTQYDYDGNGNLIRTSQGIENAPRVALSAYDGFDRRTNSIDAMGNLTINHFDANNNIISEQKYGELIDVPGSAGNIALSQVNHTYDSLNRLTRTDQAYFDTASQVPISDGVSTTRTVYNDNSGVIASIDARGLTSTITYDTANRRSVETDAKGNTVTYAYDANGNNISTTDVDHSDLGNPNRVIVTTFVYDSLNRGILGVDNLGNTNTFTYDSRNNPIASSDGRNNITTYLYDGLGRMVRKTRQLTSDGTGTGTPTGTIVTTQTFDENSRLISQSDDNTNTTYYVFDSLNRRTQTIYSDGSREVSVFDTHNNPVLVTDRDSNTVAYVYDSLNRPVTNTITRAASVSGTTYEYHQYDGLSRIVRSQNDFSVVTRSYDSLSHITRETQQLLPGGPTNVISSTFDAAGNRVSLKYPGGRTIYHFFDNLNRLARVQDQLFTNGTPLAVYNYLGPIVERRDYGNGTRLTASYDGLRRLTNSLVQRVSSGGTIENRGFSWDPENNRTADKDQFSAPAIQKSFVYDSANRLVQSADADSGATSQYTLDGVGNRLSVSGSADPGSYALLNNPSSTRDFLENQYTATPFDTRTYDQSGNLISAGTRQFTYDYRNELVQFTDAATSQTYAYIYDALGRRLAKIAPDGSQTQYCYSGNQEIEEKGTNGLTAATYVWGNGIDELLQMERGGQDYYYHSDDLGSVREVTDGSANVVEQYQYGDYGSPQFFNGAGGAVTGSQIGNQTLFTGRRYDAELGWYYFRSRYLDPRAGRFVSADSVGIWQDPAALGNGYAYVGNNPLSYNDPMGTGWLKKLWKSITQIVPKPIVGVDAELKLCMDFATGDWDLTGSLWAGAGARTAGVWTGFSWTGKIESKGNKPKLKLPTSKAPCSSWCNPSWLDLGHGFSFSYDAEGSADTESNKKFFKNRPHYINREFGVVSCSLKASFNADSNCEAGISGSCEADFIKEIGGGAGTLIEKYGKKVGLTIEAGVTGELSIAFCATGNQQNKISGVKLSSAKACLGAFIRAGVNIGDHP